MVISVFSLFNSSSSTKCSRSINIVKYKWRNHFKLTRFVRQHRSTVCLSGRRRQKKERNPNSRKKKRSPSARHSIAYLFQMISRTRGYFFRWISVSKKPKLKRTPNETAVPCARCFFFSVSSSISKQLANYLWFVSQFVSWFESDSVWPSANQASAKVLCVLRTRDTVRIACKCHAIAQPLCTARHVKLPADFHLFVSHYGRDSPVQLLNFSDTSNGTSDKFVFVLYDEINKRPKLDPDVYRETCSYLMPLLVEWCYALPHGRVACMSHVRL